MSEAEEPLVLRNQDARGVVTLTLNRPQAFNALSEAILGKLQRDLAVASSSARFAVSGVNVGLFCSTPGVALSRNVLRKQAFEMLVTGEFINADEAKARGLINRVAEPEQLDAELEKIIGAIISKPRTAVAIGKEFFYRQAELGIAAAYEAASQTMACNMMDEAALEGVQAFIEKRPPRWKKE